MLRPDFTAPRKIMARRMQILDVFNDPEANHDQQLALFTATSLGPDEAMAYLDRLDQEWWPDSLPRSRALLPGPS
jgi:hypothetical protein